MKRVAFVNTIQIVNLHEQKLILYFKQMINRLTVIFEMVKGYSTQK